MRRLAAMLILLALALNGCSKKNPNVEPPPAYDGRTVAHHKFDGGASDPYGKSGEAGGEGGGEAAKGSEAK